MRLCELVNNYDAQDHFGSELAVLLLANQRSEKARSIYKTVIAYHPPHY